MFFAQRLLVLKNRRSAMGIFSTYTQTHPAFRNLEGPPYQDVPLLNFIWFLLLSTERYDGGEIASGERIVKVVCVFIWVRCKVW